MTPIETAKTIADRFSCLIPDLLTVKVKGNILTLKGSLIAVTAMDRHVMEGLIPNHCTPVLRKEMYRRMRATYTYRFEGK